MIKIATLDKYTIYEVHDEQTYFMEEVEDYHPVSAVNQLMLSLGIDTPNVNSEYYFLVEDSAGKSSQVSAHKGWVVDFVPYSQQKGVCLNDYTEA